MWGGSLVRVYIFVEIDYGVRKFNTLSICKDRWLW